MHDAYITESIMKRLAVAVAGALLVLVLLGVGLVGWSQRPLPPYLLDADQVALSGYDPVSYFPEGGSDPSPGQPSLSASHEGRVYRFESEENRRRFLAQPARYEPQYGGWCAYAVAHGYKYEVDPESFLVVDGRLLLFYRGAMGDAKAEFEREGAQQGVAQADQNWPALRE
jgi:YHS domain-containing protein